MSDVQNASDESIDDQRDTATGGLVNDTPGLPTQPPSSPGVRPPSALGGIAGAARQFLGGAPPPRPAQQGRSPYQYPGQSQVPPGGPQSPQNPSRWSGTTASLALPQGSVQPQANFTPYMPGPLTTSHTQWGQVEPYPNLPQSFEIPGILGNVSNFFSNAGSPAVAMLALSMGSNGAAFMDGIQKGQEFKAKMHLQKMKEDAQQLEQRQQEEMSEYYNIVDEYEAASGARSSGAVGSYAINGVTMMDALANKATELGDDKLLNVLGSGNVHNTLQFINRRNDNWQNLAKANQKTSQQEAADAVWGGSEGEGGGGQAEGARAEGAQPGVQHVTPDGRSISTDPGKPAPRPSEDGVNRTESGDALPADDRSDRDKSLDGRAIALLKGYKPQGTEFGGPVEMAQVGKRMIDIKSGLANIASDPNLKTRQQVLNAVAKKYGPEVADDLAGYADYTRGMGSATGSAGGGGPEREYFDLLTPLARKIKPPDPVTGRGGWSQRNYAAQQKFQNDSATQTVLLRSHGLASDAEAITDDLKYLEAHGRASTGLDMDQLFQFAERDPIYAKLYGDWKAYNDAFNTIVTGGRHVESGAQAQEATAPVSYASPAAFRAAMKGHMKDVWGMIEGEHTRWASAGGGDDDMPSYDPKTEGQIRDMRDMDWLTGTRPGETYTNPKTGETRRWQPKNTLDPYDPDNWKPVK